MAVTVTPSPANLARPNIKQADVEATADGDTTATFAHGLGAIPEIVYLTPLASAARVSGWIVTTVDATNVEITKTTDEGSGAAGDQVRITAARPHSAIR